MNDYARNEKLLSVPQAAVLLRVSERTAYRMVADGIIGSARRGTGKGRIVILRSEVAAYLAAMASQARRLSA